MTHKIELNELAYLRLQEIKQEGESLSEVILRCVPRKVTVEELVKRFAQHALTEETLDRIEQSSERRRSIPHRSAE